ncbi:hypothetical protein [Aegicerativicinus sediminis]
MNKVNQLIVFVLVTTFGGLTTSAQQLEVGAEYVLIMEDQNQPKYVNLPSKREILKRGAIADYQALNGVKVVIESVGDNTDEPTVILKRKDGKPFFRFFNTIKANVSKAVENGELVQI